VGKSKTVFKLRHSNHKQEVKKQVKEKTFEFLAKRELYWQHQLRVYGQQVIQKVSKRLIEVGYQKKLKNMDLFNLFLEPGLQS
jgi:hypothetical protein